MTVEAKRNSDVGQGTVGDVVSSARGCLVMLRDSQRVFFRHSHIQEWVGGFKGEKMENNSDFWAAVSIPNGKEGLDGRKTKRRMHDMSR